MDWLVGLRDTLFWFAGAWALTRLLDMLVWRGILKRESGPSIPRIVHVMVATILYLFAAYGAAVITWNLPVTSVVVSSTVVVGVLGLALQGPLSNMFAGLALTLEGNFRRGDWVELEGGTLGAIQDIGWRSTTIKSWNLSLFVVPNRRMADATVHNYHLPDPRYGYWFYISLDADIPASRARRLLLDAALSCDEVLREPPPVVRFWDAETRPARYMVFVHFESYPEYFAGKDAVLEKILARLTDVGARPAAHAHDVEMAQASRQAIADHGPESLLGDVPLFQSLSPSELVQLAENVERISVKAGQDIVREGDDDDCLFVMAAGLAEVHKAVTGKESVELTQLSAGDSFGEIALLTGSRRTASVRAVTECHLLRVERAALVPVLKERPELAKQLARQMTGRRLVMEILEDGTPSQEARQFRSQATQLLKRIQDVFKI